MPLHPTSRPMGAGLGEGWGMAGVLPPLGNGPRGSPVWYVNRQLAENGRHSATGLMAGSVSKTPLFFIKSKQGMFSEVLENIPCFIFLTFF